MSTIPSFIQPAVPVAVSEEPRQYLLRIELPGLAREQVGVLVENGMVRILSGNVPASGGHEVSSWQSEDSRHGKVMSVWSLPDDVEACSVVADFRDGVLNVRLPKVSRARSWWPR